MVEKLGFVEKKFAVLHQSTENELEEGILHNLGEAFDGELPIGERIGALEEYLAMQYYLHTKRFEQAADLHEEELEGELARGFASIFNDEKRLLHNLWSYCEYHARKYFALGRVDEWQNWANLAGKIKGELT